MKEVRHVLGPKYPFYRQRFIILFFFLMVIYLISPFAEHSGLGLSLIYHMIFIFSMFSAAYSVCQLRWQVLVAVILGVPTLVTIILMYVLNEPRVGLVLAILYVIFYGYVAATMLSYVVREQLVSANTIFASLCVYFLLGLIFAMVFVVVEVAMPGSFYISTGLGDLRSVQFGMFSNYSYFFYFSFVTLTTLGYGDITPVNLVAGTFASLEAVIGQLYLVIMVARLVGLHINRRGEFQIR